MTRAILMCIHSYQPFGQEYYSPLLEFQLNTLRKYKDEFDTLYLIEDDNWKLPEQKEDWIKIVHVPINLRYYEAYQKVLPQVEEDLVLFIDNDMIVYKKNIIRDTFYRMGPERTLSTNPVGGGVKLIPYDVETIMDTIGTYTTDKLAKGNKFCPYWFGTRKDLLMKYLDIDWAPDMPYCETLGHLTEAMVKDNLDIHELEDDKSDILFAGEKDGKKSKDLGYYHCRNGSLAAYLLSTKKYGNLETYNEYLKNQPESETLRLCGWYQAMEGNPEEIVSDLAITKEEWDNYIDKFKSYHGLV